jgi:mRNA interferase HigB
MRVLAKKTLRDFWTRHPDSKSSLQAWYQEASNAAWKNPSDIKKDYPSASIIPGNRMEFNIKGNNYRLIIKINYAYGLVWIRFIGTHTPYYKIDAGTI